MTGQDWIESAIIKCGINPEELLAISAKGWPASFGFNIPDELGKRLCDEIARLLNESKAKRDYSVILQIADEIHNETACQN